MKKRKRFYSGLLIVLVILFSSGCQKNHTKEEKEIPKKKEKAIGLSVDQGFASRNYETDIIEEEAEKLGYEVYELIAGGNAEAQNSQIERLLEKNISALLVCAVDRNKIESALLQAKAKGVHSDADRDQTVPDTRRSRSSCDMERGRARRRGLSAAGGADGGECGQLFPVAVVHRPCGGRRDGRDRRSVHPASEQRRTLRPYLQHELCGEGRRARPAYRRTARAAQHGAGKGTRLPHPPVQCGRRDQRECAPSLPQARLQAARRHPGRISHAGRPLRGHHSALSRIIRKNGRKRGCMKKFRRYIPPAAGGKC